MSEERTVLDKSIVLVANTPNVKDIKGDFLFIYSAGAEVTVRFDERHSVQVRQGSLIRGINAYDKIEFESTANQTILVKYGFGEYSEVSAIITIDPDQPAIPVYSFPSDTLSSDSGGINIPAGTSVLIKAADATGNRRKMNFCIKPTAAGFVWVREFDSTAEGGQILGQGSGQEWETSAALYAYNPNGSDVVVYPTEESDT